MTGATPYSAFPNTFRQDVTARTRLIGCWSQLGSPITTEVLGLAGFDWILLDSEHGFNDPLSLVPQLMALKDSPSAPVVRPHWNDGVVVKRLLEENPRQRIPFAAIFFYDGASENSPMLNTGWSMKRRGA